jgi:hypothetical protein
MAPGSRRSGAARPKPIGSLTQMGTIRGLGEADSVAAHP